VRTPQATASGGGRSLARFHSRRSFLVGLGAVVGAACSGTGPFAAAPRARRIGWLTTDEAISDLTTTSFVGGLGDLGYVEGRDVVIDWRPVGGDPERVTRAARELVDTPVDVLVANALQPTQAAQKATTRIPIVFLNLTDPVINGIVASEAHPGGNITGIRTAPSGERLVRRVQILKELVPRVARVAVLWNATNENRARDVAELQRNASSLKVEVHPVEIRSRQDMDSAFARIRSAKVDALTGLGDGLVLGQSDVRASMAEFALRERLPYDGNGRDEVVAGALMAYSAPVLGAEGVRRIAAFVDKILRGASPADIPVEGPTRFELVVNLCTADKIGVQVPAPFMNQVTEVIQCGP
jgi:putative ABC transport system substrate-binding protein